MEMKQTYSQGSLVVVTIKLVSNDNYNLFR